MDSRSGRAIGVSGLGDPDSDRLVLFCHPSPGASGFDPDPTVTGAAGLRIVSLDRPGFGATEAASSSRFETWVDDVAEFLGDIEQSALDATGTDYGTIAVVGWGVGAVYAARLAALRPQLVDRLALVAPPEPGDDRGDAAMLREDVDESLHPGFADRRARMLASAGNGDDGRRVDRAMLASHRAEHLSAVEADALIVATDDERGREAAGWYRDRIRTAEVRLRASRPGALIVDTWREVLEHCRERSRR